MVKCLPEFEYFIVFLKNKNIISKIRRSKVTGYAALSIPGYKKICKFTGWGRNTEGNLRGFGVV